MIQSESPQTFNYLSNETQSMAVPGNKQIASLPKTKMPVCAKASQSLEWNSLRGIFNLQFTLDPPAGLWSMDTPQDYNMNRRDIVCLKTLGRGVLTHACCARWAISESNLNVGRQMASIVLAGVPAFSVKLAESHKSHNKIIRAWLKFYEQNKHDLVPGKMTPLLPTPASAAIRIEAPDKAYFGLFEAAPGVLPLTHPTDQVTIVNAFSNRIAGRLEGVKGKWHAELFDHCWQSIGSQTITGDKTGLTLNLSAPDACFSAVLTRQ